MKTQLLSVKILFAAILFSALQVQAQWQKTAGPPGINVNVFFKSGASLFAGTTPNGVFISGDNGVTWSSANRGIEYRNVFSLTSNNNFLFAGTDSGVFRSSDNGATWQAANSGIEQKFVVSFAVANGYLFAGSIGGLYKSSNNGDSWSDANGGALTSSTIHDISFSANHLTVISDNLIFYSDDNGNTWNYNYNAPFILSADPFFLTVGDSVLLANGTGIFRSFDGGINWGNFITIDLSTQISGMVIFRDSIFAGSKKGVYASASFGKTWTLKSSNGLRSSSVFNNHFYQSGNNFLLAYDEIGVAVSADEGKNWNYTSSGFTPAATIDNALLFSNNTLFSGTHGDGIYSSSNAGNSWIKIGTGNNADTISNSNIFALLKSGPVLLAGTCGNGLYRSADNGATWERIRRGLPQQSTGFLCVQSLAKTRTSIFAATDQGLYYSNDGGLSWLATNLSNKDVTAVAANDSVACAAVESLTGTNNIYHSVNNPATFTSVFQSFTDDWVSMATDGKTHFYAGTLLTGNYVSNNNGLTWQSVGPGIPAGSGGFAIAAKGRNVFIGNLTGVYFSNNNGASFTEQNTGFDRNHSVQGLAISPTNIYAGLFLNSVWKRSLTQFNMAPQQPQQNTIAAIISPNPMQSESQLSYTLQTAAHVIINVYDASGNLRKQLFSSHQNAGAYNIIITKKDLPAGNYFVSLTADDKRAVMQLRVNE